MYYLENICKKNKQIKKITTVKKSIIKTCTDITYHRYVQFYEF